MNEPDSSVPDRAPEPLRISHDQLDAALHSAPRSLDEVEFLDDNEPLESPRPPGPGLPESLLWVVGIIGVQIFIGMAAMIVLVIISMPTRPAMSEEDILRRIDDLNPDGQLVLFGLPNLLGFLALIGLGCWRLGRPPSRKLNLSLPTMTQLAIMLSVILPLGMLSDALWHPAESLWKQCVELFPGLDFMEESNIMKFLEGISGASLPLLLFFLAVVPAVGEEFMLRGLIGRGLVARWGVVWGVLITSCLFAGLHMYPPHVAAIFPVGVMLHITYLTTRSFWAPILFHFVNNAYAAYYTSLGLNSADTGGGVEAAASDPEWMTWLTYMAPANVLLCGWMLWLFRTRYVDESGTPVWPGYHTVEHPDPALGVRRSAPNNAVVAILFSLLFVAQLGLVVYDARRQTPETAPATDGSDDPETAVIERDAHRDGPRPAGELRQTVQRAAPTAVDLTRT